MSNIINIFQPIRIEYNAYNGFIFSILRIETYNENGDNTEFDGEFFGIHFAKNYLVVYLLFFSFEIKKPF
jgi:hypothetical protein